MNIWFLKYGTTISTFWGYLESLQMAGKIDYDGVHNLLEGAENIEIALKD
jgi:hypothetical protein